MGKSDYQRGIDSAQEGDASTDFLEDMGRVVIQPASDEYWEGVHRGREIRDERRAQESAAAKAAKSSSTHESGYGGSCGGYGGTSSSGPGVGTFIVAVVVIIALLSMCQAAVSPQGGQVAPAAPVQDEPTVAPRAPEAPAEDRQEEVGQSGGQGEYVAPPQPERQHNQFTVPLNPILDSAPCFTAAIHPPGVQSFPVDIKWAEKNNGNLLITLYSSFPDGTFIEVFPCVPAPAY